MTFIDALHFRLRSPGRAGEKDKERGGREGEKGEKWKEKKKKKKEEARKLDYFALCYHVVVLIKGFNEWIDINIYTRQSLIGLRTRYKLMTIDIK